MFHTLVIILGFMHKDCNLFGGPRYSNKIWEHPHWHLPYEPNVVRAFKHFTTNSSFVIDIGANVGGYSIMSALNGAEVLAIEMQPVCVHIMKCLISLNEIAHKIHVLHGFLGTDFSKKLIMVPTDDCEPMGSPEAVAGRWPVGVLRKKNYHLDTNKLKPVHKLNIKPYIHKTVDLVKIDTEGCEINILLSLKNKWKLFKSVVIEFQSGAWSFHNVSKNQGIYVLQKFIPSYSIFYLGHNTNHIRKMQHDEFIDFIQNQNPHSFEEFLFTKTSYPI